MTELELAKHETDALRQLLDIYEEQLQTFTKTIKAQQNEITARSNEIDRINIKLKAASLFLQSIHKAMPCGLIVVDSESRIESVNDSLLSLLEYTSDELVGAPLDFIFSDKENAKKILNSNESIREERKCKTKTGTDIPVLFSIGNLSYSPNNEEKIHGVVCIMIDIRDRKKLESELQQAQKMESIGRLATGIAHEINTPIQYIGDNMIFLKETFQKILNHLQMTREVLAQLPTDIQKSHSILSLQENEKKIDLPFLVLETPHAVEETIIGTKKVATIVQSMKEFSHPGVDKAAVDLNKALKSTVTISHNIWKNVAEVVFDLDASMPQIVCLPGEINQVLLNLIINATHAIEDKVSTLSGDKGIIKISTSYDDTWAIILISDTGIGIQDSIKGKIFDPFFSTKETGRGAGQGLYIAHKAVVENHKGRIEFDTVPGKGTIFKIYLPLKA